MRCSLESLTKKSQQEQRNQSAWQINEEAIPELPESPKKTEYAFEFEPLTILEPKSKNLKAKIQIEIVIKKPSEELFPNDKGSPIAENATGSQEKIFEKKEPKEDILMIKARELLEISTRMKEDLRRKRLARENKS